MLCVDKPFSGQTFEGPITHRLLSSAGVLQNHIKWASANTHSVSYLLHINARITRNVLIHWVPMGSTTLRSRPKNYVQKYSQLTRRFCKTLFSTAWQFSPWTANNGHPDGGSSLFCITKKLGSPSIDHGIWWHIFTTNNSHSVVNGWTFSSIKNSITAPYRILLKSDILCYQLNAINCIS